VRTITGGADPWSRVTPLHVTGSALIVHPASQAVLLRWHQRQRGWLQVGGHGDAGEHDPIAIALREGYEETGLTDLRPWPTPTILHVVIVRVPASDKEPAHEHADIRYLLATHRPDEARPENPEAPLRWLTFDQAALLVSEDNVRETLHRAQSALAAADG
jgi:8-oxo-dGTP pyrophosphatase MutT (NUDIX family)